MNKTKNVFISHHSKDEEHINKLKELLSPKGYNIKNSSIESSKDDGARKSENVIKRLLRMRIHWAGTFVCLIGTQTHTREWVDWEIDQANKKGKRIVGVFTHGASNSDVPENLEKYRDALVGWNSDKIIDAIEGRINSSENPDGTPRAGKWKPVKEQCDS